MHAVVDELVGRGAAGRLKIFPSRSTPCAKRFGSRLKPFGPCVARRARSRDAHRPLRRRDLEGGEGVGRTRCDETAAKAPPAGRRVAIARRTVDKRLMRRFWRTSRRICQLLGMDRLGYLAVSAAAVLWAIGGAYASYLIDEGASFVELTEARAWITALGLGLVAWIRRGRSEPARAVPLPWIVVFGCSIAAANLTYYASLARLPVAIAITVQYTAPGLVVLWIAVAERRRPSTRVLARSTGAIIGVALLAEFPVVIADGRAPRGRGRPGSSAAASAMAFATYIFTRGAHGTWHGGPARRPPRILRRERAVVGRAGRRADVRTRCSISRFTTGILFLAVATTIAPFVLFVWGLERIRATDAAHRLDARAAGGGAHRLRVARSVAVVVADRRSRAGSGGHRDRAGRTSDVRRSPSRAGCCRVRATRT